MKKIRALCVLLGLSVIYIIVQAFFLGNVSKQGRAEEEGQGTQRHKAAREDLGRIAYDNVREIIRICDGLSLPIFIIDPDILTSVMSNSTKDTSSCLYLCSHMPSVAFAVMHAALSKVQKSFESEVRASGFSVSVHMDGDPRRLSLTTSVIPLIPTHIIVYREGHTVQLVVFVERTSGFWWHGDLETPQGWVGDALQTNISTLKFGAEAGAYEKMEILKVNMDDVKLNAPRYPTVFLKQMATSTFIECNYTRARQFHYRYPRDESPEAMLFRKKVRVLMNLAKSRVLDPLGAPFWLSSGTCLGWFRQCDVIPYSKDVDFGMFIKHYDVRLIAAMQMNDMPLKHLFGKPEDSFELSFQGGDVKLDMFFFYEEPDHTWNGGTQARTGNKYKYIFPKFTLCWTEFLEIRVRVPCETEAYIEANYGRGWFEPVRHWDWKRSPPNVRPNGRWAEVEMDRVVQHFDVEH